MSYTDKILERATIKGVADYLLFGIGPNEDARDYEERLEAAQQKFDAKIMELESGENEKIIDLANEMTCRIALIYAELGMQASLLMMKEMLTNLEIHEEEQTVMYRSAYDFLLAQVQMTIRLLKQDKQKEREKAVNLLKSATSIAEQMLQKQ